MGVVARRPIVAAECGLRSFEREKEALSCAVEVRLLLSGLRDEASKDCPFEILYHKDMSGHVLHFAKKDLIAEAMHQWRVDEVSVCEAKVVRQKQNDLRELLATQDSTQLKARQHAR